MYLDANVIVLAVACPSAAKQAVVLRLLDDTGAVIAVGQAVVQSLQEVRPMTLIAVWW